ncbi:MAG TPA: MerR family transcriptional regulator [Candidatus Dietzia intestinipullorum]|nr:MerR family transcriptional regulator [Candidatus Dietzia intestinipullorum]
MRIGEIARLAGVSARSIRHYHRLGVLAEPPRTGGGYRDYAVADLARIARIAFLSGSGVPLREIGALLEGSDADPAADLAALRDGIDQRIADLTRQRERLDVIARRAAEGLPPGLLPESVTRALDFCRADAAGDAELSALLDREHDMLDLVALQGDFPEALSRSYSALAADPERRRAYLDMLAGFHRIEGRRPAAVESEIATLVDSLLADADLRALVAGAPPDAGESADASPSDGPTLEQLLPDPAQREVLRRTLTALGVVL